MKSKSIRSHLKPYSIFEKRKTTISNAFASAIAPSEVYDENRINKAMKRLGQNPRKNLICVYCGKSAETWDHVIGLVKNSESSGFGHTIGNLLPCCKKCNSEKGNKNWLDFLKSKSTNARQKRRILKLRLYLKKYLRKQVDYKEICPGEIRRFNSTRNEIFSLMKKADEIARGIRLKTNSSFDKKRLNLN